MDFFTSKNENREEILKIRAEAESIYLKYMEKSKKYREGKIKEASYKRYIRNLMKKAIAFKEKYNYKREYRDLIERIIASMNP